MNLAKYSPPRLVLLGISSVFGLWCVVSLALMLYQQVELSRVWTEIESHYVARFALMSEAQLFAGSSNTAAEPLQAALTAQGQWSLAASITEKIAALNTFETNLRPVLESLAAEPAAVDVSLRFQQSAQEITATQKSYNEKVQLFNAKLNVFPRSVLKLPLRIRPFSGFHVNLGAEIEGLAQGS